MFVVQVTTVILVAQSRLHAQWVPTLSVSEALQFQTACLAQEEFTAAKLAWPTQQLTAQQDTIAQRESLLLHLLSMSAYLDTNVLLEVLTQWFVYLVPTNLLQDSLLAKTAQL